MPRPPATGWLTDHRLGMRLGMRLEYVRTRWRAGIAEYLKSDKRPGSYWGSDWLKARGGKGWGQKPQDTWSSSTVSSALAALCLAAVVMKKF